MLAQTPGGKSYDAVLVLGSALDQMIKDGFNVKEASLGFNFDRTVASNPWEPGKKFMEYIKNVSVDMQQTDRTYSGTAGAVTKAIWESGILDLHLCLLLYPNFFLVLCLCITVLVFRFYPPHHHFFNGPTPINMVVLLIIFFIVIVKRGYGMETEQYSDLALFPFQNCCNKEASKNKTNVIHHTSLLQVSIDGLMSPLSFDQHGSPRYAEYDIVNLGRTGFIKVRWKTLLSSGQFFNLS